MAHNSLRAAQGLACLPLLVSALPALAIDSIPVRITNPATAPVPVTGAVGVTGPVSVSGTVGVNGPVSVTGAVGVTGPVSVTGTVGISGTPTVNIQSLPPVTINPATPLNVSVKASDTSSLFSVPVFVEQNFATPTLRVLSFNVTLAAPAILENVSADCGGSLPSLRFYIDGGPSGLKGTSVTGDSNTGIFAGALPSLPNSVPYYFFLTPTPDGFGYILPVSPIGAPVNSGVNFYLYPDTTKSAPQCNFNLVFRTIS